MVQKTMERCVFLSIVRAVFLESAIINQFLYWETKLKYGSVPGTIIIQPKYKETINE